MAEFDIFFGGPAPKDGKKQRLIKISSTLIEFLNKPIAKIATKNPQFEKLIYSSICAQFEKSNNNNFVRYDLLWKKDTLTVSEHQRYEDCAIVMQGKIDTEANFTLNTLLYYRRIYPNVKIILSTWEDEPLDIINKLRENKIQVVLNKYPDKNQYGRGNINLQLISSLSGVEKAKEIGNIKYVLKTRTDQRIYMQNFLQYFLNLLEIYKIKEYDRRLNSRMIFMNCEGATSLYYAFKLSDMLVFGEIEDLYKLYNIPKSSVNETNEILEKDKSYSNMLDVLNKLEYRDNISYEEMVEILPRYSELIQYKMATVAELYIISQFILSNITRFDASNNSNYLDVYHDFLKKYTIIIDKTTIELYWKKYQYKYYKMLNYQMLGQLDHARWLEMYVKYNN